MLISSTTTDYGGLGNVTRRKNCQLLQIFLIFLEYLPLAAHNLSKKTSSIYHEYKPEHGSFLFDSLSVML